VNILILYATKHGSSEKAAHILKEKLNGQVTLFNLSKEKNIPVLYEFDNLILGGSIHAGQVQSELKKFCTQYKAQILEKPFGLFLCCMDADKATLQFEQAYPEVLRNASLANGLFGGEFLLDRMNVMERFLVKKIAKVTQSVSQINDEAIHQFAQKFTSLP
jgi:menaquinone-dependent protoporphyrinogen oxidase